MFTAITHSQIYVLDQDEALDFDVGKLGLEVHTDADLGLVRWLTVNVPDHPDRQLLLERPGTPALSEETAAQVRDLLTKGAMGGHLIFSTDDCRKTCETLRGRGVEITDEPTERPYGIDCGVRDPFGNSIRFTQPNDWSRRSSTGATGGRIAAARYPAVAPPFVRATSVGGPAATTRPPASPPPGPRSITQSAPATTDMSCSTTMTVCPASTRPWSRRIRTSTSAGWRPVVGSSRR